MKARLLLLALGLAAGAMMAGAAWAVLPDAPKPKPKPTAAVSAVPAAPAASTAQEIEAHEAALDAKRAAMESCLSGLAELRRTVAERCVMAAGTCYDKSSCEVQPDGRHRCTAVNAALTARHEKAMAKPCRL